MKIYIACDLEGISGIVRKSQVLPGAEHYSEGRRYMTDEINACIDGCFKGGATEVLVRDAHCNSNNVIWEQLDERAEYIIGTQSYQRFQDIDGSDGLILLGYHAMAGTQGAVLEHTFTSVGWQNLWMNGMRCGELAVDAAIAGKYNVPVIMTSGDDKLCNEAASLLPNIVTAQVKTGINIEGARLLPQKKAHALIHEKAALAVKKCKKIKPYKIKTPVTLRLEMIERGALPFGIPYIKTLDGRTVEITADDAESAMHMLLRG